MLHYPIPVRAGSKGVPLKNILDLGGRPLIARTIQCAQAACEHGCPGKVIVNTDSQDIAGCAFKLGAEIYIRPAYLAGDESSMRDVLVEYSDSEMTDDDILVTLFPTVPFRRVETLTRAVLLFQRSGAKSLMSVRRDRSRPYGGLNIMDGRFQCQPESSAFYRRQDTPSLYYANGSIFICHPEELKNLNTQLFNAGTQPLVVDGFAENLDIDEPEDFELAQTLIRGAHDL